MSSTDADTPEQGAPGEGRISRRKVIIGSTAGLAAAAAGGAVLLTRDSGPRDFRAARVDGELPVEDPDHDRWRRARRVSLPLVAQEMATPFLADQTLSEVHARALFNGTDLGLLLEWDDDGVDEQEGIATFRDAVAVMLPGDLTAGPPPIFMGWEGQPVYLAHWKASWQADIDRGFQDVGDKHPNWYSDVHPFHQTLTDLGLDEDRASVYAPARHVGNAMSQRERSSPVEELSAEGYGSLTHLAGQHASGRGVHTDRGWRVTIGIRGGQNAPDLSTATTVPVALAVWQGEHQQRGGRKQYVDWTELILQDGA